ncbi:MAG TPA: AAA family ATPase, partial [Pyrinomonadaceae bacterium]
MFKLKRLEISGFKSFADYTDLVFTGDGITAIVGPNGCGKSNVSDAISWVLGEQRAKSLRGGEMKDVIFQGSRNRLPSSMAEVVLHLVRDETAEPADPDVDDIDSALEEIDEHDEAVEEKLAPEITGEAQQATPPGVDHSAAPQSSAGANETTGADETVEAAAPSSVAP